MLPDTRESKSLMSDTSPDNNPPPHILIVDDSKEACHVLVSYLTDEGFWASAVHNGRQALQEIFAHPPDLVLLDVMMPSMDGLEVLQTIREHPATVELPVIMVTALDTPHDVVQGFELGASDYIPKPIQFEVLLARVRTQIKVKRLQDQRARDIKRLRELDALKDKFIQIAAHDLQNPISNLVMGIEMLDDPDTMLDGTDEQIKHILNLMRGAANMMNAIVNDFLDIQAFQAGRLKLEKESVSLNAIAEVVIQRHAATANRKSITVEAHFDHDLPECMADPDRLAQVIGNLVSNAIKFSPRGTAVRLRTFVSGEYVRFEVEDHGPGIPEDEMPLLFQEFARLSNTPTGGEKSSGVGLAISRWLVEAHGGRIGAESAVGEGSLFWFEILTAAK